MIETDDVPRVSEASSERRPVIGNGRVRSNRRRVAGLVVLVAAVGFAALLSLAVGAKSIAWSTVIDALAAYDGSVTDHLIVRELRWPRTMLGLLVGAALGTAGALMQGVTRNPLADPGLLGVNAGAAFAVVLAIWAFGTTSASGLVWFAFVGAGLASVAVYL
ncbi:FecCD family ABC transporter permease, partial [Ilumatobacter sp.]|uniref:FecCD family ABC transporter permease n=1 Tax=Ilumatobacter sp. TaxID=1967498 RepID=UPI003C5F7174